MAQPCPEEDWIIFCEDFEDFALQSFDARVLRSYTRGGNNGHIVDGDNDHWYLNINYNGDETRGNINEVDISITDEEAHGGIGNQSAKFSGTGFGDNWINFLVYEFDTPREIYWGRAYLKINDFLVAPANNMHWWMIETIDLDEGNWGGRYRLLNGYGSATQSGNFAFNYQPMGSGESGFDSRDLDTVALAQNEWMCFEWLFDSNSNWMSVWRDGEFILDFEYTQPIGSAHAVAFGLANNAREYSNGFEIYYDNIALGEERVGCISLEAQFPSAQIVGKTQYRSGEKVLLNARNSSGADRVVTAHLWEQITSVPLEINHLDGEILEFEAPVVNEDTDITFSLIVVDDDGLESQREVNVLVQQSKHPAERVE